MKQQGSCRAEGGDGLKGPGWSGREAAGERAAAGAAEARECTGVFSAQCTAMLILMLGGDLDVVTRDSPLA